MTSSPTEQDVLDDLAQLIAESEGLDASDLCEDVPIFQLPVPPDAVYIAIGRVAERYFAQPGILSQGQSACAASHEMPAPAVIAGLRDLAVLFPSILPKLMRFGTFPPPDTLRSIAASIYANASVASDLPREPIVSPRPVLELILKYALIAGLILCVPGVFVQPSCMPLCEGYYDHSFSSSLWRLVWGFEGRDSVLIAVVLLLNAPAMLYLVRHR